MTTHRPTPMVHDALRNSELTRTLAGLLADFADLVRKEVRLARAELTEKIAARLQAMAWMAAAGLLGLVAALLVIEGIVFALANWGMPLHWACLLVAAVLAMVGAILFYQGRSLLAEDLLPSRTARQINQDIETAKEQLT